MRAANLEAALYNGDRREWFESMEWDDGGMTKKRFVMVADDLLNWCTIHGERMAVADIRRRGVLAFAIICRRGFLPGNPLAAEMYIVRDGNPDKIRIYKNY